MIRARNQLDRASRRRSAGMSLIELLVAMTIGVVLIFGAAQVYMDSSNTYPINESLARLQENARYALSVLEPDIRMANYWGLVKDAALVDGKAPQFVGGAAAPQSPLGGAAASKCGTNFGLDLTLFIEGTNDSYSRTGACAPYGTAMPNADTVTVRRASTVIDTSAAAATGPLRICSTRTSASLVTDSTSGICTAVPTDGQVNDLIVHLYYVDKTSSLPGSPSLRRKYLTDTPDFDDEEIVTGIEDMQIQYGVDLTGGKGVTGGAATEYLNAGTALTNLLNGTAQIVSVRV